MFFFSILLSLLEILHMSDNNCNPFHFTVLSCYWQPSSSPLASSVSVLDLASGLGLRGGRSCDEGGDALRGKVHRGVEFADREKSRLAGYFKSNRKKEVWFGGKFKSNRGKIVLSGGKFK
jgi:hypothetical protein